MLIKLCKLFVSVFLLYSTWYSQIWGDNRMILYASVGLSMIFMVLDAAFGLKRLDIRKINPIVKMYIIFGVYAILSGIIVAVDKKEFISSAFTYISFSSVVFEMWYISFRTDDTKWILNLIYALALLCAITTILFGQEYRVEVIVRTMGKYNNPNTLGVLMVFGIFSVVFQKEELNKNFILKYLSIFLFLYIILLSGSRKALLAGVGLFVFWVLAYFIDKSREKTTLKSFFIILTIIASIIGALVYIFSLYSGTSSFERMILLFSEGGTNIRVQLMKMAVKYWMESPIFGIGLDQFRIWNPIGYYSHSTYAEILSCTGIVGCILFFVPLMKLLIVSIKKSLKNKENAYKMRICLLMLTVELFLGAGQIFIYSVTHMIILFFISNIVYEEAECGIE